METFILMNTFGHAFSYIGTERVNFLRFMPSFYIPAFTTFFWEKKHMCEPYMYLLLGLRLKKKLAIMYKII